MKYFVAGDIHGSEKYCSRMIERYKEERADRILLLGDLLYHGPRNELPDRYDTMSVFDMLNGIKDEILAVRGNCDAEVDQMVLEFPMLSDSLVIGLGKRTVFATHGHIYGESDPPALHKGDILLCGHTHVPGCTDHGSFIYMNPGSVSLPKNGSWHGYMIMDENECVWKDLDGQVRLRFSLN